MSNEPGRKKEKGEREKMPFIVSTYVSTFTPRAAHALRSDQCLILEVSDFCIEVDMPGGNVVGQHSGDTYCNIQV